MAQDLDVPLSAVKTRRFPDGESLVTLTACAETAFLYRPLNDPNAKVVECLLAAEALRANGARQIVLVAPYLGYMRQDIAFHPGEAVSQKVLGKLIGTAFDGLVTVDPHLHRTKHLEDVCEDIPCRVASAAEVIGKAIKEKFHSEDVVVIGPDEESEPLIRTAAKACHAVWTLGTKVRKGDRHVALELPSNAPLDGRIAVIVDDVISSGTTVVACSEAALARGAKRVVVYATHALFSKDDADRMMESGVTAISSCDSVKHPSNAISLSGLLAKELRQWR